MICTHQSESTELMLKHTIEINASRHQLLTVRTNLEHKLLEPQCEVEEMEELSFLPIAVSEP